MYGLLIGLQYFVTPFSFIQHEDKGLSLPMGDDGVSGTFTGMIKRWIEDIIYGKEQHEWAYIVEES
jgi:branched-chain amino acid aminotransferase